MNVEADQTQDKFILDMIHNIEELAELQKEITKWCRGNIRKNKLEEEITDTLISLKNIHKWLKIKYNTNNDIMDNEYFEKLLKEYGGK